MSILDKLTSRNFLAVGTGSTFLGLLAFIVTQAPELVENPIVTAFLGAFTTLTALVYQFYFRTSGSDTPTTN
jgi:fluoride ion exporter CrcB/FEX